MILGLGLSAVLLGIAEIACRILESYDPGVSVETSGEYQQWDEKLGYGAIPGVSTRVVKRAGKELVFDVTYRTDEFGRRVVPFGEPARRDRHLLFFGCSVAFGEGIPAEATTAAECARLLPDHRPYIYAHPGYGPQQMLEQLVRLEVDREIAEAEGVLVYAFIDDHVGRAIGDLHTFANWGADMPCYELVSQGEGVERRGTFADVGWFRSAFYHPLYSSALVRRSGLNLPLWIGAQEIELTAGIIRAARKIYLRKFPQGRFCVLIYPSTRLHGEALANRLTGAGIEVLDYARLLDPDPFHYKIHDLDHHPNAEANKIVARRLVEDLSR